MSSLILATQKLFGLLELDPRGTVIFSEVATFLNVAEFRQRFETFDSNPEPSSSFMFNCDYEDGAVPVKVLLARLREDTEYPGSVLVYIKKADPCSKAINAH